MKRQAINKPPYRAKPAPTLTNSNRPVVLIGPVSNDPAESVSAVNRAFVTGLEDRYRIIPSAANRRFGATRQSRFNAWNIYYLVKHLLIWLLNLIRWRPAIAHFAISSGAALWKGLLFLRIARALGARTVGHLHSGGFLMYWNKLPPKRRQRALNEFRKLDAFVVLSEKWRAAMRDEVGVPASLLHVVNNPIDSQFEDAALRIKLEREKVSLLGMGIMSKDKGVIDLIDACAAVAKEGIDFRLYLAGPEREPGILQVIKERLREYRLEKQVEFLGVVHGEKKLQLFQTTSISILPSYYENFPLVLLEAAAAGHALVTTPVGAVPEFFNDGSSALFVEIADIEDLANAIRRILLDADARNRLAREARLVFCTRLARTTIMESLNSVYLSVMIDA